MGKVLHQSAIESPIAKYLFHVCSSIFLVAVFEDSLTCKGRKNVPLNDNSYFKFSFGLSHGKLFFRLWQPKIRGKLVFQLSERDTREMETSLKRGRNENFDAWHKDICPAWYAFYMQIPLGRCIIVISIYRVCFALPSVLCSKCVMSTILLTYRLNFQRITRPYRFGIRKKPDRSILHQNSRVPIMHVYTLQV